MFARIAPSAAGAGRIILLMRLDNARVNVAMRFMEVVLENHAPKRNAPLIREEKFTRSIAGLAINHC